MMEWTSPSMEQFLKGNIFLIPGIFLLLGMMMGVLGRYLVSRIRGGGGAKLDALKEKYDCLLNGGHESVLIFSRDDERVVLSNASFLRTVDAGRRDIPQSNLSDWIVTGEDLQAGDSLRRILNGETVDTELLGLRKKDGTVLPVSASSTPVPNGSGRLKLVQLVLRDMNQTNSLRDKLSRKDRVLAAFGVITRLLNSGDDTPARFKGLVRIIGEVMESDTTSILFLDKSEAIASGYLWDSLSGESVQHVAVELDASSIYSRVSESKQPLLREELTSEMEFREDRELYEQGIRSYLIQPLILRDKVMGTLNIFNRTPGAIRQEEMNILGQISSHLTLGVNNIQLQREAEKKAQRLKQILVTSNSFRLQVFLDDLLREIVWSIRFSTGFNLVVLSMLNNETKRVEIKALADNERGVMKRLIGTTYSWESFRALMKDEHKISHSYLVDRKELVLDKIKKLIQGNDVQARRESTEKRGHALFVPIETRLGRIVGFLLVDDSTDMEGQPMETVQMLEIFANQVAVVIDNQRLFEDAKNKTEKLEALNSELQESKTNLEEAKKMLEVSNRDLERANSDLREVDKLKAEFLQNVTHELRTPLAPIMVNSEVLLLKKIGDLTPVQEDIVKSIFQSTKRLNSLIDDLLDLTKMESGKMRFQFALVNPESLVNNRRIETYPSGQEKNITITKRLECGKLQIHGDSHRLMQLVTNLLRNSIKFTPEGGRIDLCLREQGDERIELKVSDTGVGIPASKLDKIFDRFYQVDGSATRKYKGAGLGLAIVKKIVEAHGGEIGVESKEGEGTTFTILLPARIGGVEEKLANFIG